MFIKKCFCRNSNELNKNSKLSNISLDSLSSPAKHHSLLNNKPDNVKISMDSLVGSVKTENTASQESLLYQLAAHRISQESVNGAEKQNFNKYSKPIQEPTKLNKINNKTVDILKSTFSATQKRISAKQNTNGEALSKKSFLSQRSKEILARRANKSVSDKTSSSISKLSTNSSTTKSSSPKLNEINKSKSTSAILRFVSYICVNL